MLVDISLAFKFDSDTYLSKLHIDTIEWEYKRRISANGNFNAFNLN